MELKVGQVCDRGLNPRRTVNQDRFLAIPERGLFAVFDGVGGQQAGEVASQTAAETVEEALANVRTQPDPEAVRRAIEFANRDIFEMAESEPAYKTMATTVALLHIANDRAIIAHVGDSRIYRLEDGQIHRETIDHTDLNDRVRAGLVSAEEAARQEDTNVINRALGVGANVDVEIKTIKLREGARFLLCSDGIYKHLSDAEIARLLAAHEDPQRVAEEMKRTVYERGADDNLTAVIVQAGRARKKAAARDSRNLSQPVTKKPLVRKTEKLSEEELFAERASAGNPGAGGYDWVFAESEQRKAGRPTTKLSESEIAPPLAAPKETTQLPAGGGRIRVEFGGKEGQAATPDAETGTRREARSVARVVIFALLALVLAAGAFYAGLRSSDWVGGRTSEPGDAVQQQIQAAREMIERGDYEAAVTSLNALLTRDPKNAQAHYWLGRAQLEQRDYAKAAQSFEQAFTLQPTMHDAYVQAAAAYEAADNRRKAVEMLNRYAEERRRQTAPQR